MGRREEGSLAGKQCKEPDGNSMMLGSKESPGRIVG